MVAYWRRVLHLAERNHEADGELKHDELEQELRDCVSRGLKFATSEVIRCHEEVSKWRRIDRLVKRFESLEAISEFILSGCEDCIRRAWYEQNRTREQLVNEARKLNVINYGKLTKKELLIAIEHYKRDKVHRQKFERKH